MNGKWIFVRRHSPSDSSVSWPRSRASPRNPQPHAGAANTTKDQVFKELPKAVQKTVEKQRGKHEVTSFQHVMRDGKEFYRAVIDTKGERQGHPHSARREPADRAGRARDVPEPRSRRARPAGPAKAHRHSARWPRSGETDGEIVDFDRLPGEVKTEIGRLAKGDKIQQVVKYKHRGHAMYRRRSRRREVPPIHPRQRRRQSKASAATSIRARSSSSTACPAQVKQKIGVARQERQGRRSDRVQARQQDLLPGRDRREGRRPSATSTRSTPTAARYEGLPRQ